MIKFAPFITIYEFEESKYLQHEVIWTFSSRLKGISPVRQRFNIHVVENADSERKDMNTSIKSVWKQISKEHFLNASENEKRIIILNLITDCLMSVSEELAWSERSILLAREQAISQNIQFQYTSKIRKNKSGDTSAKIRLELVKNKVSIWIEFSFKNKQESITKHLIDTNPENISFFHNFDTPIWLNDTNFGFLFKNGMTLSISAENSIPIWSKAENNADEWFKKIIAYDENTSLEELAKLANS